jgi:dTDP-4-amino-4,6-dideoxygalactose transaminase
MKSRREQDNRWGLCHGFGTCYGVEEMAEMAEVMLDWAPTNDAKVREFEQAFAAYTDARHAIAVANCAAALHLAAIALDIGPGSEVLAPPITFPATANAFAIQGALIRFVDVDPVTLNMDPARIEPLLSPRTRAIVPVDLNGLVCDMDEIMAIGTKHGVPVIQDAAHSVGALYKGRPVGSLANVTAFSFQRSKNMSTLGEGGMITTDDSALAERMTLCRQHGAGKVIGLNYRMTDIQAAAGLVQLARRLDVQNDKRRRLAHHYSQRLAGIEGITLPFEPPHVRHPYHLYSVRVDEKKLGISRDGIMQRLRDEHGIWCIVQYPCVHLLDAYRAMGHGEGECPVAESESAKILTLPINPRLEESDIDVVADALRVVLNRQLATLKMAAD